MGTYPRLDIVEFGKQLLVTGDLDPIYVALNESGFPPKQKLKWLVGYIAFYNAGVASYFSEIEDEKFWQNLWYAAIDSMDCPAGYSLWPRGKERRHFRRKAAGEAVSDWWKKHPEPHTMLLSIADRRDRSLTGVIERAKTYRSVGNWLAFKIADLVDACMGRNLDQSNWGPFLYDLPRNSLLRVYNDMDRDPNLDEGERLRYMVLYLQNKFKGFRVPHNQKRPVDMFCIETIACKHASHLSGSYPLYNDIREIREGLEPWKKVCKSAGTFLNSMPRLPQ